MSSPRICLKRKLFHIPFFEILVFWMTAHRFSLAFHESMHSPHFGFVWWGSEHVCSPWLCCFSSSGTETWEPSPQHHILSARNFVLNPHLNNPGRMNSGPKNFWKTDKLIMHIIASWLLLLLWQDLIITSKVSVGTHTSFKRLQDDTLQ